MPWTPADRPPRRPDDVLAGVYAEGLRRRRRRQLLAGTTSAVGLLGVAVLALGVAGGGERSSLAGGVLSSAAGPVPAPGSGSPGHPPAEPGASPSPSSSPSPTPTTTAPPADPVTTTTSTRPPARPSTTVAGVSGSQPPGERSPGGQPSTTRAGTASSVPVASTSVPPVAGGPGSPTRVTPDPRAVDLQPQRFEATRAAAERTLAVRYWSGVSPCSVLGRVDVVESTTEVVVTLWVGRASSTAEPVACVAVAVSYETLVELQAPLGGRAVVDGAA